mmetsp:Transcript_59925/g.154833  ORF Transcript_59925/g.154833 Transcript_59925/m.154833 type:complete len:109 (+) Transcript_59925:184-510(+)
MGTATPSAPGMSKPKTSGKSTTSFVCCLLWGPSPTTMHESGCCKGKRMGTGKNHGHTAGPTTGAAIAAVTSGAAKCCLGDGHLMGDAATAEALARNVAEPAEQEEEAQ